MQHTNIDEAKHVRNPERPDNQTGIAVPHRTSSSFFQGWGPKLMGLALVVGAFASTSHEPAMAASVIGISGCGTADREATLRDNPTPSYIEGAGFGTAVMRLNLSAEGKIDELSVEKSSGSTLLDIEAMRVVRGSHFEAARANCNAVGTSVLYDVIFD
jgi:TonB family protein